MSLVVDDEIMGTSRKGVPLITNVNVSWFVHSLKSICGCPKMVSPKTGKKSTHTLVIYYQSI